MMYFQQEKDYTCGIACLRMCFSVFNENLAKDKQEWMLEIECESSKDYGTFPEKIVEVAQNYGFEAEFVENGTIDDVRKAKELGYVCILLISVDVPHCVIYLGDNGNHIYYSDPFFGEKISKKISKFTSEKTLYPFSRWKTDIKSVQKYYPLLDTENIKKYEGKGQFIKIRDHYVRRK